LNNTPNTFFNQNELINNWDPYHLFLDKIQNKDPYHDDSEELSKVLACSHAITCPCSATPYCESCYLEEES
jgi:hypothetical protein